MAVVSLIINELNDAPVANDDATQTEEDRPVELMVLANDTDAHGDRLSVIVDAPAHGTAVLNVDGSITYTPTINFDGIDSFTYTVADGSGETDSATITVEVTSVSRIIYRGPAGNLYMVNTVTPGSPIMLNPDLVPGGSVLSYKTDPARTKVAYAAYQDSTVSRRLYVVDMNTPGQSETLVSTGGVIDNFQFTPDGSRALYRQRNTPGRCTLWT